MVVKYNGKIEYVIERWQWGVWEESVYKVRDILSRFVGEGKPSWNYRVRLAPGGWSGNEDIIKALRNNELFWMCYYEEWKRGGLWVFEIPEKSWEGVDNDGKDSV